jgi:hypothetical protein
MALLGIENLPAAPPGGEQHGERAVLGRLDGLDGVHDDDEPESSGHPASLAQPPAATFREL